MGTRTSEVMIIGIVAGNISDHPAGLERYIYEFVSHLTIVGSEHTYNLYVRSEGVLSQDFEGRSNVRVVKVGWGILWKEIGLHFATKSDVYFFTGPITSLSFRPRRSIVIAYDFAYKRFGRSIRSLASRIFLDILSMLSFSRAERIVCISEETRADLVKYFKPALSKAVVIYPGYNHLPDGGHMSHILHSPFFLFAGTIKERKNILNIIRGFDIYCRLVPKSNMTLVLAGKYSPKDPYYISLIQHVNNIGLGNRVCFLGRVSDEELGVLYRKATAFVYPSFIEGFGLPILETMDAGLPVITSNCGATKETAGDAAIFVDPFSPEDIGKAMRDLLSETSREELIRKGRENTNRFSWNKMAEEFLALLNNLQGVTTLIK
ncbi:MAG: glycosyltransferase family 1 protein [Thermodesulfobacteriota bacterium]